MAIIAAFKSGQTKVYTKSAHQYDKGQRLIITGIELPQTYEVHISNEKDKGFAAPLTGDLEGVFIPDSFFMSGDYVYAWVYAIEKETAPAYDIDPETGTTVLIPEDENEEGGVRSGITVYEIVIPVIRRPIQLSFDYGRGDNIVGYIVDDNNRLVPVRK